MIFKTNFKFHASVELRKISAYKIVNNEYTQKTALQHTTLFFVTVQVSFQGSIELKFTLGNSTAIFNETKLTKLQTDINLYKNLSIWNELCGFQNAQANHGQPIPVIPSLSALDPCSGFGVAVAGIAGALAGLGLGADG